MNKLIAGVAGVCLAAATYVAIVPFSNVISTLNHAGANRDPPTTDGFRNTRWEDLGPKDWDQFKLIDEMSKDMRSMSDSDPRAIAMMKKMKEIWDDAPTNPEIDGKAVRIPGYIILLDQNSDGVKEMLLVPYYGACIHSPPPPSNQIIHVLLPQRVQGMRSMDTVWARGTLQVSRSDSSVAASSYLMTAKDVEPYSGAK